MANLYYILIGKGKKLCYNVSDEPSVKRSKIMNALEKYMAERLDEVETAEAYRGRGYARQMTRRRGYIYRMVLK